MMGIRKGFLQFIFSGAYMKRWNDKLRPMDMYEVDKQAHKMIVAWLLLTLSARNMSLDERLKLEQQIIEGGIFDYFYRLIITDIKPPVFYSIKENPEHYRALSDWVLSELSPKLSSLPGGIGEKFQNWVARKGEYSECGLAQRILDAAHIYASSWEFNIIKQLNSFDEEIPEIDASFKQKQAEFSDLPGASELSQDLKPRTALGQFASLCGQLRFQARWSQTPRIPETSVMGHMFMVACYAYFFSLGVGACPARAQNNFFSGLFHDLPELLTRDIISPVKKSVPAIEKLLHDYELKELDSKVFTPLREAGHQDVVSRLSYFLGLQSGSEFDATAQENGQIIKLSFANLHQNYNKNEFDPKDGELLKLCDLLAAFLEAYTAVRNGVAPAELQEAIWRMKRDSRDYRVGDIHFGTILDDFD